MRYLLFLFLASILFAATLTFDVQLHALPQNTSMTLDNVVLIGLGDSLTQGTMDATNNATNTSNAYLQKVYESLNQVTSVSFMQPFLDKNENRMMPFFVPTNLGIYGEDVFSLEGVEYYKRYAVEKSFLSEHYFCDKLFPWRLDDLSDKVLYPINLLARKPVSQLDAALWLLNRIAAGKQFSKAIVLLWIGNNDSSNATLGYGTYNPLFFPLPFNQIEHELNPLLSDILRKNEERGTISFEPYKATSIERNLTEISEFYEQYNRILTRLQDEVLSPYDNTEFFLCTLPYYNLAGYLIDSVDLEFYLRKVNPGYFVPLSFKRAVPGGEQVTDFLQGDRISLFTFLTMYILLDQGYPVSYVNQVLEADGIQRDGLVLSEEEQRYIDSRIDSFNCAIKEIAQSHGPHVHLIDIGQYLNQLFTGENTLRVKDKLFTRKWGRGNAFTMDGVHPGYTTQALIANFIVGHLNDSLQLNAPLCLISDIAEQDPYIDKDNDGWVEGGPFQGSGITELLFLLKDPDDDDSTIEPVLPSDIWNRISEMFFEEFFF